MGGRGAREGYTESERLKAICLLVVACVVTLAGLDWGTNENVSRRQMDEDTGLGDTLRVAGVGVAELPPPAGAGLVLGEVLPDVPVVLEVVSEPELPVEPPEPTPLPVPRDEPPAATGTLTVHLTFYVCAGAPPGQSYCGTMASGNTVYEGAAACGYGMALGTQFSIVGDPTQRTYVCEDRGAGSYWWIDVFWYDYANGRPWRNQFGQSVEIEVVQ